MNTRDQTLGSLAGNLPGATRVFLRHGLDFCCGGERTLAQACRQAGIDADQVAGELEAIATSDSGAIAWGERPLAEVADHIVGHYHEALRRDVPALLEAARRVERVHKAKPDVPAGLAELLGAFWDEMLTHMQKEEQVLFPMIRRGARGQAIYMPVRVMEEEHDEHGRNLERIRELTGGHVPPSYACATWRALYEGLAALERELKEHISLENNVLFPRAIGEG